VGTSTQQNEQAVGGLAHTPVGPVVLSGIVGSQAYGLANQDSDVDRAGVFVAPTLDVAGLFPPDETFTQTDPDYTYHEVGKFIRLALNANPTVLEMLFLERYEVLKDAGAQLVSAREVFLSKDRVFKAFGGYAMAQIKRLQRRGDGSFSSDTRKRREKHARHTFRLLLQGRELLEFGTLTVRIANPDWLFEVGALGDEELAAAFNTQNVLFEQAYQESTLRAVPDLQEARALLRDIRRAHLD
jgi:uncharacterized protein